MTEPLPKLSDEEFDEAIGQAIKKVSEQTFEMKCTCGAAVLLKYNELVDFQLEAVDVLYYAKCPCGVELYLTLVQPNKIEPGLEKEKTA